MNKLNKLNPFGLFLSLAVLITLILGAIGLYIYRKTGAYSLDLSRPGYQKIHKNIKYAPDSERLKINKEGVVDQALMDQVEAYFEHYIEQINNEAFAERSISDQALGLGLE